MAFNFMAALGGFSRQVSENIESEKQFNREKKFRMDMLAEEEATKQRLAESADRKAKQELLEQVTDGLAYYIPQEDAAAVVKTYGVNQAKSFLSSIANYKGDVATALKLPEIKNGVYGSQLVSGEGAVPQLSSFLTPYQEPDDAATTIAQWQINYNDDLLDAMAMPDGKEKQDTIAALENKFKTFIQILADTEEAKAKASREPKKDEGYKPFYSNPERANLFDKYIESATQRHIDYLGKIEEYKGDLKGTNSVAFSNLSGISNLFSANAASVKDKYVQSEAISRYKTNVESLNNYAVGNSSRYLNEAKDTQMTEAKGKKQKIDGVLSAETFQKRLNDKTLKTGGTYIIKKTEGVGAGATYKIETITYLGFENPFTKNNLTYLKHRRKSVEASVYNNIMEF